jgi:hypothetical protein
MTQKFTPEFQKFLDLYWTIPLGEGKINPFLAEIEEFCKDHHGIPSGNFDAKYSRPTSVYIAKPEIFRGAPATPPEGYRYLLKDETLKEGDELWGRRGWESTCYVGQNAGHVSFTYRRKIKAAPRYRFLQEGETVKKGDETQYNGGWNKVGPSIVELFHRVLQKTILSAVAYTQRSN